VSAALDEIMSRYDVKLLYADPPYWESEVDTWVDRYGDRVVISWYTRRVVQMHAAAERLKTDISKADTSFSHDGCPITSGHMRNARAAARPQGRYVLAKAAQDQKIDVAVTSILAHEAAMDAVAAGMAAPKRKSYYYGA
jgi:phage terminase large subunit-like protein